MNHTTKIREQRNQEFESILAGLNPAQKRAVENIQGPMLVVAGPGTGKTHMVAARIGSILKKTDIGAKNILCLTFTNAGVVAMRERLLKFLGPEAHKVNIYTFHSFCDTVIRDHPELFGHQDMEPVSELEQMQILEELLKELPYEHILRKGYHDPTWNKTHIKNLVGTFKQEGWTLEEMEDAIQRYEADIPATEGFFYKRGNQKKGIEVGDLNPKGKKEFEKMNKLRAGMACLPVYEEKMKAAHRYEFADMINWVVEAFKTNEDLLSFYQEQFQYVLVDEYQDTNGSQHDLLHLLTSYWDDPNLFVVGDDDQSIFEFQGARLENIKDFYKEHEKNIELVVLEDNYRSSRNILEASQGLIERNEKRLIKILPGITKDLNPANKKVADYALLPQLHAYDNNIQEIADIVSQIEALIKEGVSPKEIAVIYAKNAQSLNIQELLLRRNIPFQISKPVDILETALIEKIETLLFYLDVEFHNPNSGDYQLFKIMHYRCWGLDRKDLSRLAIYRAGFSRKERPTLRSLFLKTEEELTEIGIKNPSAITSFFEKLEELIQDIANLPLYVLVEKVLAQSGMVEAILAAPNGLEQLQILQTFKSFLRGQVRKDPKLDIDRLLLLFQDHRNNRLAIPLQRQAEGGDKVYLTTAHGSKGLEFDYVFMLNCSKKNWSAVGGRNKFTLPPTLTFSGTEDAEESRRRLFYVAMTRAKRHLAISFSKTTELKTPPTPAPYLSEVMEIMGIEELPMKQVDIPVIQDMMVSMQRFMEAPKIDALPKETIAHLLKDFKLSASAMNTFIRCRLSFYFDYVLAVPGISSPAAAYGTAMHKALQAMYRPVNEEKKLLPKAEVFKIFELEMEKMQGYFESHIYTSRMEMGKESLEIFYEKHKGFIPSEVLLEHKIYNTEVNGVPVGGDIDRVDIIDKDIYIYDYKTGKPNSAYMKPAKDDDYGGNYWRQLLFYKLLYWSKFPGTNIVDSKILYLKPNDKGDLVEKGITAQDDQTELVATWVKEIYTDIMDHKFYDGCEEEHCQWCDFVRQSGMNLQTQE